MNAYMNITARVVSAQAQREIDFLRKRVRELEAEIARLNGTAAAAGAGMNRTFADSMRSISKWGSQIQWAGRQLTANFTMPLAIAGGFLTKFVLDNEAGMVRIQKVYGDAATGAQDFARDIDGLSQAFDLLSTKYATQRADVLAIAGDWAAAGATGGSLARGVEATLQTMVLGEMEAADATEALIAIQAQYGASTERLIQIIQTLNATENETGITFGGLVDGMARSASAARSAGVDVDHLAAMLAAISPAAGSAGQAGNALKTIFSRLLGPTRETREVMGAMGINIDDLAWKSLNGAERLERLADAYMNLEGAGEGMISSQAGVVSALVASRWQINRFDVLMRDLAYHIDENSDTNGYYTKTLGYLADKAEVAKGAQRELNAVLESSPYAMKRAGIVIQNSLMKVVAALLPQIIWLAETAATLAERFSQLDPGLQKLIIGFFAFLAVLGPPIVLLGTLAVALGQIGTMLVTVGGAFSKFGGFIGKLMSPLGMFATLASGAFGSVKTSFAKMVSSSVGLSSKFSSSMSSSGRNAGSGFAAAFTSSVSAAREAFRANLAGMAGAASASSGPFGASGFSAGSAYSTGLTTGVASTAPAVVATGVGTISTLNTRATALSAYGGAMAGSAWTSAYRAAFGAGGWAYAAMPKQIGSASAIATTAAATGGRSAGTAFVGNLKQAGKGVSGFFKGLGPKIAAFVKSIPVFIKGMWPAILQIVKKGGLRLIAVFTGPWGIAIAAALTLLSLFGSQLKEFFQNIWRDAQDATTPLGKVVEQVVNIWNKGIEALHKAFQSLPEGVQASLRAVVNMVKEAGLAVYKWFSYINPFARHSPSLVENVTNGMRVVGDQFGLAAGTIKRHMMNAYSSLKMFGTATKSFMSDYASMQKSADRKVISDNVGASAAAAFDDLHSKLGPLYSDLEDVSGAIEKQSAKLARLDGNLQAAQRTADSAQETFNQMQGALDSLSAELDDANNKLSNLADSPIEGMRAMSDAIFENEMAQKRLRLEMMMLGDVDISDLEGQLASLQGEIEQIRGEQTSLQQSGAGSEILSVYDDQIAALEAQQGAINDSVAPLNEMQKQLEQLQRAGEILDLENSIEFDPLNRQIDQLAESYNELPFDEIVSGITAQKDVVNELQSAYDEANAAVEAQGLVLDAANAKVAAAQAAYDAQRQVLEGLQTVYDAVAQEIQNIESAINDVVDAAREMESALEAAKGAAGGGGGGGGDRMTPGLENFLGAAGGAFPDVGDAFTIGDEDFGIDAWLDEFIQGTGDLFSQVDIFGPIKQKWNEFTAWWSGTAWPATTELFSGLWTGIKDAAGQVDWLAPVRGMLETVQGWFGGDSTVGEAVRGWFDTIIEPWRGKWEEIKQVLTDAWEGSIKPSFDRIKEAFAEVAPKLQEAWDKAKPIIDVIKAVFVGFAAVIGGAIMLVITLVSNVIASVITPLVEFITGVVEAVIQIFTGVIEFVTGVFTGDWELAWQGIKDIFGGTWDLIVSILEGAWDIIWGLVEGLVNGVVDFFTWLWDVLVGNSIIPDMVNAIIEWFKTMWDTVVEFVKGLVEGVVNWFIQLSIKVGTWVLNLVNSVVNFFIGLRNDVVKWISNLVESVVSWFAGLPEKARNAIGNVTSYLKQKGSDIINGLWDGLKNIWKSVSSWFGDLASKVRSAIGDASSILYNAGKNIITGLWDGLKSKWESVKSWFGGIGDWIADNKGPKEYDLKLLVPAGNWIMTGLQNGLIQQIPNLKSTLGGVADTIFNSIAGTRNVAMQSLGTDAAALAGRAATAGAYTQPAVASTQTNKTIIFNGDLSFPNITDADEADEFLKNLQDLAGTGEG